MNNQWFSTLALMAISAAALAATSPVMAASDEGDARPVDAFVAQCEQWAAEEGVPADELDMYVQQCLENMGSEGLETARPGTE